MQNASVGLISFAVIFGGALIGISAARVLPTHHLTVETRTTVSGSVAIVGTLAALVIGLLISTASGSFLDRSADVSDLSSDLVRVDRTLDRYGPEAKDARAKLHAWAAAKAQELFPDPGAPPTSSDDSLALVESIEDAVVALTPKTPQQEFMRTRAIAMTVDMTGARWKLLQQQSSSIPMPFLVLLMFWLALVFASFGLFAPRNATAIAALILCSMAVSGGIVMILEFDSPGSHVLRVSAEPMRKALIQIER
jgi:hypothetical protein